MQNGKIIAEQALSYAGVMNTYRGKIVANAKGKAELQVLAMDAADANFGMFKKAVTLSP